MRSRLALLLPALIAGFVAPAARGAGWVWPVDGRVIGRFHLRWSAYVAGSNRGIDIGAPLGTPVVSACSGRVAFAGWIGTSGRTVSVVCGGLTATYVNLGSV